MGQGLLQLDSNFNYVNTFSEKDGLPHNSVSCIQTDRAGNLWIGTYSGLAHLDVNSSTFYRFSQQDGLPDDYFIENACNSDADGTLYFGTKNGIVFFDPSLISIDERPPNVVITGIDLYNEPLATDTSFTHRKVVNLKYNENYLRVHFSGLHYATSDENAYKYQLEDVDREWVSAASTQRFANYTNLAPGSYVFRVKASNSDGVWNEQGASITFVIDKPYWVTWWFISLIISGVLFVLYGLHKLRVFYLLKVERTRQQISADLHDDIGSSLTSIALFMDFLLRDKQIDETLIKRIKYMGIMARQLVEDLRDTVWIVKTEYDNLKALVKRMEQLADIAPSEAVVQCQVLSDIPEITVKMEARRHLLFIYKEALQNAQKHSEASKIEIMVDCENEKFSFKVRDNGIGFDKRKIRSGNGLKNFKYRASKVKADLDIESNIGRGTLIGLSIKLADIRDGMPWT